MDGLSADGSVVVGSLYDGAGSRVFRWTEATGFVQLGFASLDERRGPVSVSADGTTVVRAQSFDLPIVGAPVRWTESRGLVQLGFGASQRNRGSTSAVNRDGSVVVGALSSDWPDLVPFRWTESGGMTVLELPQGAFGAMATNVSADGSTVVGQSFLENTAKTRVFRWTESKGSVNLDAPADAVTRAVFVSDDGSVIVGVAGAGGAAAAFRWTERTGFVGLGPLPGFSHSQPTGMTADGSVVVGVSTKYLTPWPDSPEAAFRWTETSGLVALEPVSRATSFPPRQTVAVSADGSVVVGSDGYWDGNVTDTVVWNAQGCASRVRLPQGSSPIGVLNGVSRDGRTIIGNGIAPTHDEIGWAARLR